ncbi:MAG: hypothetical protein LN414_06510 [Candidatus Thermoplasmatota archaeon]|nr:hypothetical protein [Candidatus Thermoplasmatota archaeon]
MMDWDDLAWKITGPEGGPRYFRMGMVLVVMGIVAMAAIGFTPIFRSDESSLTYDTMAENPDDAPIDVPKSQALGHARWALVGSGLTLLMGLALILEGKRVINLRRMLSWHAEARATALFSLAAMLSSIALFAGASLVGLGLSMPMASGEDAIHTDPAMSPAGIAVVATMGLATVGMLGMAYYNAVLSVYRGGGALENRRMARFAMSLAFLSLAGVVVLRMGTIMSTFIEITLDPITIFDAKFFYTMSRISYQATLGAGEAAKGVLDWQLTIASALLFLSYLAAMAGLIGGSARSLGGNSLRVRRAAALPTTAIIMTIVALLMLAWASTTAPTAVRDSWGVDDLPVSLGWGLLVGVVSAIGALALALAYIRGLGLDFAREALSFWKKQEVSEEALEDEEGIPQPMLDQALSEDARARGEFPPPEPEVKVPTPPLLERLLLKDARRNQAIIFVVLIVLIILLAVLWPRGGGDGNGNGDPEDVRIEELPLFHSSTTYDQYLNEVDGGFDLRAFDIMEMGPTILYFIDRVDITVTWTDESSDGPLWTNTPDEFDISISDALGLDNPEDRGENPQGGQGSLDAIWTTGGPWVA